MKKILLISCVILFTYNFSFGQVPARKGWWKFDEKSNLLKAEIGKDLVQNGSFSVVNGPKENDFAIRIGVGSYLKVKHEITPNPTNFVNQFTLAIDFKVPALGKWYCFYQTSPTNANDGECFMNTSGKIGVAATGYSSYAIKSNEWYRLVISVKNGSHYQYYLDGQLLLNGTIQSIDGRFSLDKEFLLFADEDGEDNEIDCAEISLWDVSLTKSEIESLGGFGHIIGIPPTRQLLLVPYLQNPTKNSLYVCWHDTSSSITKVEYGITNQLGQTKTGTSEIISGEYRWHSVKLENLTPNTEYFYKIVSGSGQSEIYSFRTVPNEYFNGKIRFLLLSDTHNSDTTMAVKVIKEAKKNIEKIYGSDIHNQINAVLHSGDLVVSGNIIKQWTDQYFAVMFPISTNIPFLTVTGNHELEHQNYYKYMQYDEISGYPPPNSFAEKFWSTVIGNTMIIGINTNLTGAGTTLQNLWLEQKLQEAEANTQIDFIFVIGHHFAITELWGEGITYDSGPSYIANQVFPILKKYSKVIQYSYGHTHGFERGTVESLSSTPRTDFRMVCGGGGGGATDRWGAYKNQDFDNIHISFDDYFYQIIEIDVANKTFESSMYSLGNTSKSRNNELRDRWYIKLNQQAPAKPTTNLPVVGQVQIVFNSSPISADSIMTTKIQVAEDNGFTKTAIDTMIHWKNIYKVDASFNPIDKTKGIDLTKLSLKNTLKGNKTYYYRVKYRDHNLKWSEWSNTISFNTPTSVELLHEKLPFEFKLYQNYPNPFNPNTIIEFSLPVSSRIDLKVYDMLGREIITLASGKYNAGNYKVNFDASKLASGLYIYRLIANGENNSSFIKTMKMILTK
ncbi:MAG: fibronectin type III domain-containing protein [Stygiobacter sp.]